MLLSTESMKAAVGSVLQDLRKAARLHNIPVETLRRLINGSVKVGARSGPVTVLNEVEEDALVNMGYSLTTETVMELAFKIVDKLNPFHGGKAGWAWFEGFRRQHPQLSLHTPQPLS